MAGRPRMPAPPLIERIDLPADMMRRLGDLSRRRAWPLIKNAFYGERSFQKGIRDVYLQGLWDGYECALRAHPTPEREG